MSRFTTGYRVAEANVEREWVEEGDVKAVKLIGDPSKPETMRFDIETTTSIGFSVPCHALIPTPEVGEPVVLFGGGFGDWNRGCAVGEVVMHYITREEAEDEQKVMSANIARERRERLERDREDLERRTNALRLPLRARVLAKRARSKLSNDDWDANYWAYELFTCEEAQGIFLHFRDSAELAAWFGMSGQAQQEVYPGLSDQHSGNTFDAACILARLLFENEAKAAETLGRVYGTMAPLVGSDEAG